MGEISLNDSKEVRALKACILEAKRFLEKARYLQERLDQEPNGLDVYPLRERSAAMRSSLDLSGSLAEFRRSRT